MTDRNPDKGQPGPILQQAYHFLSNGEDVQAAGLCHQLLQQFPRDPDVLQLQAVIHEQAGRLRPAIQSIQRAIKTQPANPVYYLTLARIQHGLGRLPAAEQALKKALSLRPGLVAAHFQLGVWCAEQQRYQEAEVHYRDALVYQSGDPQLHNNLATVLHELGRYKEATDHYRQALELQPGYLTALLNMANSQKTLEAYPDAEATFKRVLALRPDLPEPHVQLGEMLRFQGQLDKAAEAYRQAIKLRPDFTEAWRLLSQVQREHLTADIDAMEVLAAGDLNDEGRMHLQYALAKVYEDQDETDKAFSALQAANRLYRARFDYDVQQDVDLMRRLTSVFDADFFAARSGWSDSVATPIFIIGMPRSGTTLAESILASHPDVFGAGEINIIAELAAASGKSFPAGVSSVQSQALSMLAATYLERLARLNPEGKRLVVNKMPSNFLYLGLIYMMFPRARVIHCLRDPLDTCLSCFKQYFVGPQPFAYDLEELGRYYGAYQRLMEHWRTVLPGYMFELQYETLVQAPEQQMQQLLAYCGLDWDERCLEFHRQERQVRTASSAQVRQPIYQSSKQVWEKYRDQLQPLIRCLQDEGVFV